jgi:hypothetical protein
MQINIDIQNIINNAQAGDRTGTVGSHETINLKMSIKINKKGVHKIPVIS